MQKKNMVISIIVIAVIIAGIALYTFTGQNETSTTTPIEMRTTTTQAEKITIDQLRKRVLIYDSLYREFPNDQLLDYIVQEFKNAGFQVDVYRGRNATLDPLVAMGEYGIVILRAHGAYNNDESSGKPLGTYIYTGLYLIEAQALYGVNTINKGLDDGLYAPAVIPREGVPVSQLPKYLSVSPKFFKTMAASLNNTIVFYTGCFGMNDDRLANVLISKGAYMYIGWDGNVTWVFSDQFLKQWVDALIQYRDPVQALAAVNSTLGTDPDTGAVVKYKVRG
ncbi:MAG: hypothetical protein F7C37_05250 [Desulfurococcales archaeon]|nr:hypothetical protein [Desulfurococcales archaeon]MCE4622520.1 hypothetical protein [Desulfurococcales archaeon]